MGLAVYDIKGGKLDGVWVPFYAPGMDKANLGTEQLAGSEKLDGEYQITAAKAPKTGEPYAGTVTIAPQELQLDGDVNTYRMTWHFGEAKVHGVGIRVDNSLVVSSGTGKEFAVVRFKLNQGNLVGDFFTSGAAKGYYTLLKD